MNISIQPKETSTLAPADILFQTAYWSRVKSRLGWRPIAFDFQTSTGQQGDMMALLKPLGSGLAAAYVPQGPEAGPPREMYGLFLEALSQELVQHMDSGVAFIRYDLPWESPYADGAAGGSEAWRPTNRLRELRMNIGARTWNLRKASLDVTVADSVMVDLSGTEADMGSVSPGAAPCHPFYGMYRFKAGFGGQIVHRNGSWDFSLDRSGYEAFRNFETTASLKLSEWDAW